MAATEIDASILESLAAKVAGLDLTTQEDEALTTVLVRAASADAAVEVEGYGVIPGAATFTQEMELTGKAADWGRAMGFHIHVNPGRYIGETEKNLPTGG